MTDIGLRESGRLLHDSAATEDEGNLSMSDNS
jgi:hypothetical protein